MCKACRLHVQRCHVRTRTFRTCASPSIQTSRLGYQHGDKKLLNTPYSSQTLNKIAPSTGGRGRGQQAEGCLSRGPHSYWRAGGRAHKTRSPIQDPLSDSPWVLFERLQVFSVSDAFFGKCRLSFREVSFGVLRSCCHAASAREPS